MITGVWGGGGGAPVVTAASDAEKVESAPAVAEASWAVAPAFQSGQASAAQIATVARTLAPMMASLVLGNLVSIVMAAPTPAHPR